MPLELQVYLRDVIESCRAIGEYIQTETEQSYGQDRKTRMAIERELSIVGEAISQALKLNPELPISDARKIVGFRNILVHNYARVENRVIWDICSNFIPILLHEAEAELERLENA